jgi:tripartite-type tricarboxylate transporter receptor subunit TctC
MTSFARRAFVAALALLPALGWAQQYPAKPVKIVVSFTAGGTTDILARFLAQNLSDRYKQPFVVENKPGAGGNLGTELVVHAPPDGYTRFSPPPSPTPVLARADRTPVPRRLPGATPRAPCRHSCRVRLPCPRLRGG